MLSFAVKVYFVILGLLSLYCIRKLYLVILYNHYKNFDNFNIKKFKPLPHVTVQLPIYNEKYVVKRLIESACNLNYPKEKLEIQILDDSTDETSKIIEKLVEKYKMQGVNIIHLKRDNRKGFKAGALQYGLNFAKGEFIAIFDADFIIPKDFLLKTIHFFKDPKVGLVQACWDFINREFSILTEAQALMLDGHFIIEHFTRNRSNCFFNFNGTAGIWRKKAIIDAGGWSDDTLTEDLDLSYRAQLKGWKFIFLKDLKVKSELPIEINSFKQQQHRWTKGSVETFLKLFSLILKSNIPLRNKIEAFFHLGGNFSYLLLLFLSIIMYPAILGRLNYGWYQIIYSDLPIFLSSFISVFIFYYTALKENGGKIGISKIFFLMAICIGLCVNNAKAVMEAIFFHKSDFNRTPKYNVRSSRDNWFRKKYRVKLSYLSVLEIILGFYYVYIIYFSIKRHNFASIPFLLLFLVGFFYVGFLSFIHSFKRG